MSKILKNLEKLSTKIAFNSAKIAAGNASLWGFYQPKEPLINMKKRSLNKTK